MPNPLNGAIAAAGLGWQVTSHGWAGLGAGAAGLGVALALVIVPFALRLYRGGDAKLILAMGMWLGPSTVAWAFLFGVAAGGLLGVVVAAAGGREARREIRQTVEAAVATATLPQVDPNRASHRHVPMAIAFGAGAFAALWWRMG